MDAPDVQQLTALCLAMVASRHALDVPTGESQKLWSNDAIHQKVDEASSKRLAAAPGCLSHGLETAHWAYSQAPGVATHKQMRCAQYMALFIPLKSS